MKKEKTVRKIPRILMALVLVICTMFTSVGTVGITEVRAAEGYAFDGSTGTLTISSDDGMTQWISDRTSHVNDVKTVKIQEGVTTIGDNAFTKCVNLESVEIPSSVTTIGDFAFSHCTGLKSIAIPASVTSMGNSIFAYCTGLESIEFADGVTSIGVRAFFGCNALTDVTLPESVTLIDMAAFNSCEKLTNVTLPESLVTMEEGVFANCTSLTSIEIPKNVTKMGDFLFNSCSALEEVRVNADTPANIGMMAFSDTAFVTKGEQGIKVPEKSIEIYKNTWTEWTKNIYDPNSGSSEPSIPEDKGYTLEDGILTIKTDAGMNAWAEYINDNSDKKDTVTSVVIQDGVTEITFDAFDGCTGITSITIPNTVTTIEDYAFLNCTSLESITIPESVEEIKREAFKGCSALRTVKLESEYPGTADNSAFEDTYFVKNELKGIKVPKSALAYYLSAWSKWADYIEGYTVESGKLNSEATVAEDSPVKGAALTNSKDELLNASGIFTEAEKEQIANGADANVWLELNKVDLSTVSETDQAAILAKAKDYMGESTELTYFDASLFKQITGGNKTQISEPGISMKLTIQIPTDLLPTDKDVDRQYTIIRLHNGQAEEITGTFDETVGTFTFETDKFSTYAIAYKDTAKNNGGNNGGNNSGNNGGNNNGNNSGNNSGNNGGNNSGNNGSNNGNNGGNQNGNTNGNSNGNQTLVADNTTNTPSTVDNTNTVANTDTSGTSTEAATATPDTGDNSNVVAWLVVALMGMAVVAATSRKRRA